MESWWPHVLPVGPSPSPAFQYLSGLPFSPTPKECFMVHIYPRPCLLREWCAPFGNTGFGVPSTPHGSTWREFPENPMLTGRHPSMGPPNWVRFLRWWRWWWEVGFQILGVGETRGALGTAMSLKSSYQFLPSPLLDRAYTLLHPPQSSVSRPPLWWWSRSTIRDGECRGKIRGFLPNVGDGLLYELVN